MLLFQSFFVQVEMLCNSEYPLLNVQAPEIASYSFLVIYKTWLL